MNSTLICVHCGSTVRRDPRIKRQKYCSSLKCQNARKRLFDIKTRPTIKGKTLKKGRNKRWRDVHPAHEYQKQYRLDHPEYVKRNRELQQKRNRKSKNSSPPNIVKTDAILLQPMCDGVYAGFKIKNGKIVKTDAIMLQLQAATSVKAFSRLHPG